MRRRLFNLAAAVSLVLWVATVVLWVRSYYRFDSLGYFFDCDPRVGQRLVYVSSGNGYLHYQRNFTTTYRRASGLYVSGCSALAVDLLSIVKNAHYGHEWQGFGYMTSESITRGASPQTSRACSIVAPHWSLAILFAPLTICWAWWHGRQHHRRRSGRCLACGYDLRATPGRCPECGAEAKQAKPQPAEGAAA